MIKRSAKLRKRGFTLIEMIISVALIAIAISIFVQTSGVFNDRLSLIVKKAETHASLLRLAVYLHDLNQIADYAEVSDDQTRIVFSKEGIGVFAECDFGTAKNEIECGFIHAAGARVVVSLFSLANDGFPDAHWATSTENGITRFALLLNPANPRSRIIKIDFGILPGVQEIFP